MTELWLARDKNENLYIQFNIKKEDGITKGTYLPLFLDISNIKKQEFIDKLKELTDCLNNNNLGDFSDGDHSFNEVQNLTFNSSIFTIIYNKTYLIYLQLQQVKNLLQKPYHSLFLVFSLTISNSKPFLP